MIYRVMYSDDAGADTAQAFFKSKAEAEGFVVDLECGGQTHVLTDRKGMPQNQRQLIQLLEHWGNP